VLSQSDAIDYGGAYPAPFPLRADRLDRIDRYLRNEPDGPYTPRSASHEYRCWPKRARTNLGSLVVNGVAQALYVEDYRRSDGGDSATAWRWWQANGLDARQVRDPPGRPVVWHGLCDGAAGVDDLGVRMPLIRGVSARRMFAIYDDGDRRRLAGVPLRVTRRVDGDKRWMVRL